MAKAKSEIKDLVPIRAMLEEYCSLRDKKKTIEDRMKQLANDIKARAEKDGQKDDKGSFYAEKDGFSYAKVAKKSVSFDAEKALDFFRENGLDSCIRTVEVIDEEAVEACVTSGDISYEDLESITVTKTSYSVDVKKKEDMPVVEDTTVELAASKKPRLVPKGGTK